MAAALTGRVQGKVITLDEPLPPLEGRRVRISVEPLSDETPRLSDEEQAELWRRWVDRGPQGSIEDEGERTAEIDRLYAQLGELMAQIQNGGGNGLEEQIREQFRRLRQLQKEEADALEARFQEQSQLQPGEGRTALERARQIIRDQEPPTTDPPA